MQFGVGQLPQQEIAEPLLTAGANQEIRIGLSGRVQLGRHSPFIDGIWV